MGNMSDAQGIMEGLFIVSVTEPSAPKPANVFLPYYSGFVTWYNPDEEELKVWNGVEWKNANIKNHNGITQNIVIGDKTAKFKKGILVSYE